MFVFVLEGDFDTLDAYTPTLFDMGARGMEEKPGQVWAYFPERTELPLPGQWLELPDTDWLEAWKRDLKPAVAEPFVVLAPWHAWEGPQRRIVLEPGMAFGTGHHETTRMALSALARYLQPGDSLLDLGTGSGILAIAATMLGANSLGLDIDPSVIPQAHENARINGVVAKFETATLQEGMGPFKLVVANLYAELHVRLAPLYHQALEAGGVLLLTGVLADRAHLVSAAMQAQGFHPLEQQQEGAWVLLGWSK